MNHWEDKSGNSLCEGAGAALEAHELGAQFEIIPLEGVQFRCAGSVEYVDWAQSLFAGHSAAQNAILASAWHVDAADAVGSNVQTNVVIMPGAHTGALAVPNSLAPAVVQPARRIASRQPFDFRVFADPFAMEEALRVQIRGGNSARLAASFARGWKTQKVPNSHRLKFRKQYDFCESILVNGRKRPWHRPWNVVRNRNDYTGFIQGTGSKIAENPLAEVGCPYVIRGFDYDYLGLMWLEDLVWRGNRWHLDLTHTRESGLRGLIARARREEKRRSRGEPAPGPEMSRLTEKVQQAYRILLTRALKGLYVWVKDEETRAHILASLGHERE